MPTNAALFSLLARASALVPAYPRRTSAAYLPYRNRLYAAAWGAPEGWGCLTGRRASALALLPVGREEWACPARRLSSLRLCRRLPLVSSGLSVSCTNLAHRSMEMVESLGLPSPPWGRPRREGCEVHAAPYPACRAPALTCRTRWAWMCSRRRGIRLAWAIGAPHPLRAPSIHHWVPGQVSPTSGRAVWPPLCGRHPWR